MLGKVKLALRLSGDAFDGEVEGLIQAAQADLLNAGLSVDAVYGDDPLIERAIILYAKSAFGYIAEADRFREAYDGLKNVLALSGGYIDGVE